MASCLPLLAQMPVFIIMFRVLHGLTYKPTGESAPVAQAIYAAPARRHRRSSASSPATSPTPATVPVAVRQARDEVVRARPRQVARPRRWPRARHRPRLRPARRRCSPACTSSSSGWSPPGRGEPDDVAAAAEADAVPAGGLRHLPGVLPDRPRSSTTWRRRCCASRSRPTSRAASTATTRRSDARPSGPANGPASSPRPTRMTTARRRGADSSPRRERRQPRARGDQDEEGRDSRAAAATTPAAVVERDDEAHDRAQGPADAERQADGRTARRRRRPGGARTKSSGKRRH